MTKREESSAEIFLTLQILNKSCPAIINLLLQFPVSSSLQVLKVCIAKKNLHCKCPSDIQVVTSEHCRKT